jgi:hypothetical protein
MKALKMIVLFFIVLSGCSNKYVELSEEELLREKIVDSWEELGVEVVGFGDGAFLLNCQIRDVVKVKDSVRLSYLVRHVNSNNMGKKRSGSFKVLGGCAIAGCAALASASTVYSGLVNDPSNDMYPALAWCYGIGGGIAALYFMVNGFLESGRIEQKKPYYIRENIICENSTLLRNDEVKIMLENTNSEKTYNTDRKGNLDFKINEIIPEPSVTDSTLSLIIRYEEMVDTVEIERL